MSGAQLGAAFFALVGAWMLFFQGHYSAWAERRHEERLAGRLARGSDAYFEELRALEAYRPRLYSPFERKVGGALLILFGASYLGLSITR